MGFLWIFKTVSGRIPLPVKGWKLACLAIGGNMAMDDERLIEDILRHLDGETQMGVVRMSVEMEEGSNKGAEVSHKCCNMYGRPANETVGLLDCYTDLNAGRPDNEK